MNIFLLATWLLSQVLAVAGSIYGDQRIIYIVKTDRCSNIKGGDLMCPSLSSAYDAVKGDMSNTIIEMYILDNDLRKKLAFTNIHNLHLKKGHKDDHITINCNTTGAGFSFVNSSNIKIDSISFHGCGVQEKTEIEKSHGQLTILTAFYFENSSTIQLQHVNILEAKGFGLYFTGCEKDIDLLDIEISKNHLFHLSTGESEYSFGGGIVFVNKDYNVIPCNFFVKESTFSVLNAYRPGDTTNLEPYGHGAAISFLLSTDFNNITIRGTDFRQNTAIRGGAIYIQINKNSRHNTIRIELCRFNANHAKLSGGAIEYYVFEYPYLVNNTVTILKTPFSGNRAGEHGGGFSHRKPRGYHEIPKNRTYYQTGLYDCQFIMNSGNLGSAIYLDDVYVVFSGSHDSSQPTLFDQNNVRTLEGVAGFSALYAYSTDIYVLGVFNCDRNYRTGIVLDYSNIWVNGSMFFRSNQGNNGGALALYEESKIKVLESGVIYFINNHAIKGGALYVQYDDSPVRIFNLQNSLGYQCFLEIIGGDEKRVAIFLYQNKACMGKGTSLYVNSLNYCKTDDLFRHFNFSSSEKIFAINTDPLTMSLVESDWTDIHPGEPIKASVVLQDEIGNNVSAIVRVTINDTKKVQIDLEYEQFLVVSNRITFSLVSQLNTPFELTITPMTGKAKPQTITTRINSCAFGYTFDNTTKRCICSQNGKIVQCDGNNVYLHKNLWVNANKTTDIYACPQWYCNCTSADCVYDSGSQCFDGRDENSRMCGRCVHGRTVGIGGEKCIDCSSKLSHRLGIVWLIPVIMIVTFTIVFILIKLKVEIYQNFLNSTFYFYQVVPLFFDGVNLEVNPVIRSITGMINLSGLSVAGNSGFCLLAEFSELDKVFFNYCFPACAFLGIWVFSKLGRKSRRLQSNSGNYVHAIIFVIVWAYSDLVRLTFNIFKYTSIEDTKYVFIEPDQIYFISTKHCIYAGFGILFFIVITAFPLMLAFSPLLIAQKHLRLTRMIAIFDCFKFCFKENWFHQAFASYYFICRIVLAFVKTFAFPENKKTQHLVLTLMSIIVYIVFLLVKPYNAAHDYLNYYDGIVLFLLTSIAVMAHGLGGLYPSHPSITVYNVLINIFLWLPLLWVVGNFIRRLLQWLQVCHRQRRYESFSSGTFEENTPPHGFFTILPRLLNNADVVFRDDSTDDEQSENQSISE